MLPVKALKLGGCGNNRTFYTGLFVSILICNPLTFADDSCQLRHIQCEHPVFANCSQGFGAGQCEKPTGTGNTDETCSVVVFPKGFSGSYRNQQVTCNEADGCEAVSCPQDCINDPSISCSCVAEWGLNGLIHFDPAFCIPGSIDGSCHQQYFECTDIDFSFCYQGYGAGLCHDGQHSDRNCTLSYYPDSFNNTVNGHPLDCDRQSGCESIACTDGCHGSWQLNHKTEVVPGNCAANHGKMGMVRVAAITIFSKPAVLSGSFR